MIVPAERAIRHRQAIGLIWIAFAIFLISASRAGWHAIFLAHWWRLW